MIREYQTRHVYSTETKQEVEGARSWWGNGDTVMKPTAVATGSLRRGNTGLCRFTWFESRKYLYFPLTTKQSGANPRSHDPFPFAELPLHILPEYPHCFD